MGSTHRIAAVGTVLVAAALVAATATGASGSTGPQSRRLTPVPAGATPVSVTEGGAQSSVDGHLHPASSIAGTIKGPGGSGLGAVVFAYHGDTIAGFGFADPAGHYEIDGLGGLTTLPYAVCVSGNSVLTSGATGYLGRCYQNAAFNGSDVPAGATTVGVASDDHVSGIDITLPRAAAISGTVRSGGGAGIQGVLVTAHNRSTGQNAFRFSTSSGSYAISGLAPAAKGYSVCFDPYPVKVGTGYVSRCYRNTPWGGGSTYPTTSTAVSVHAGHVRTGIDQTLPRGGAVSGRVVDARSGKGVASAFVKVLSPKGHHLASAPADSRGRFKVVGLAPSKNDRVCVTPHEVSAAVSYRGRCWKSVPWNGGRLPSGTTPVAVHAGATHRGIELRVTKRSVALASVSGTVTQASDAAALDQADVRLYRGGTVVGHTTTDVSGHYSFGQVQAGSGYSVCVSAETASGPPAPTYGWAPRCHADVAWIGVGRPTGATTFSLSAGQQQTGVGVALRPGGQIDGTVFQLGGPATAGSVEVDVYTQGGSLVRTTTSDAGNGTYAVPSLSPATYVVCFDGRSILGLTGYLPQCYLDVAWDAS